MAGVGDGFPVQYGGGSDGVSPEVIKSESQAFRVVLYDGSGNPLTLAGQKLETALHAADGTALTETGNMLDVALRDELAAAFSETNTLPVRLSNDTAWLAAGDQATALPVVPNYRPVRCTAADPTGGSSDLTDAGGALVAGDFDLRADDTIEVMIPVGQAGYKGVSIGIDTLSTSWDVDLVFSVRASFYDGSGAVSQNPRARLGTALTVSAGTDAQIIWLMGGLGAGGTDATSPVGSGQNVHSVPALGTCSYIILELNPAGAPTGGSWELYVIRTS